MVQTIVLSAFVRSLSAEGKEKASHFVFSGYVGDFNRIFFSSLPTGGVWRAVLWQGGVYTPGINQQLCINPFLPFPREGIAQA